jgi:hypothetical protein
MTSRSISVAASEDDPEEDDEPYDAEAEKEELRWFRLRYKIAHLSYSKDRAKLFELVEQGGFLAEQADHFGGFQRPGEDVEDYVLPAAIAACDWERFVHFAALAANLRALAEDLADPNILRALASADREVLAQDLAGRLADPLRRAEAQAVIADACGRGHSDFGALLREVARSLQESAEDGGVHKPLDSLIAIARRLGPELDTLWPVCVARLAPAPEDAARVWQAVAAAWLDRGDIQATGLWHALAEIGDLHLLLEIAPQRLAELESDDPWEVLERLRPLLDADDNARRWAIATFLGSLARARRDRALATWERWMQSEDVPWSAELIEASRALIVLLDSDRIEKLYVRIEDASARAALRVVDLESRPDEGRAVSALAVLRETPDDCLHWSLRYVAAQPPEPKEELRRKLGAIAGFLYELRYEASPGDLRLFLDLVACFRPDELKAHLESVVWSPASKPETLLTLARETVSEQVAELLLENAERYAAAVAPTAVAGFQLRKDLLIWVTGRLCLLRESTQDLDRAAGRLLPDEEDELRAVLAPQLASREIAEGIRDRRRRLLTLLEVIPPGETGNDLLAARSLYAAVARIDSVADEIRGLSALLEVPLDLPKLTEKWIGAIRDSGIRLQALLRLAWHSLVFQESFYGGRPDRIAAIEMVRSAFTADTDACLVALMPQLVEFGAQAGGARAVAELQEAVRRLVRLDPVPWSDRLEAFERLLACIPSIFLAPGNRRGARRAAEVLEAVARLPFQNDAGAGREEILSHWHEILPIATAVLDHLPEKVAPRVRRAFRMVLSLPVPPVQRRVFELCFLPPGERLTKVDRRRGESNPDPAEAWALAYLLVVPAPECMGAALELLPAGTERDDLALRLIRNGWLPPEQVPALQTLFSTPEAWQRAEVWLSPDRDAWCRTLAALAARGEVDPAAPQDDPLVRRLWERSSPEHLQILAQSVLDALRTGGRKRGEAALRLWLHAWLAPKPGAAQSESQRLAKELSAALHKALELAPTGQPRG